MTLLLTGGDAPLARALAAALASTHAIRLFDAQFSAPPPEGVTALTGDLRDPEAAAAAVQGCGVVIHLAPIAPVPGDDTLALDLATRGSYTLINAAREAGVRRVILGSTLALFEQMPAAWRITEAWRPRPTLAIDQLRAWLAELEVCENTRRGPLLTLCLRFGRIVDGAESIPPEGSDAQAGLAGLNPAAAASNFWKPVETGAATSPERKLRAVEGLWLHLDDAVHGVQRALAFQPKEPDGPHWHVFHITAPGPRAHIQLADAHSARPEFGYAPAHGLGQGDPAPAAPPPDPRPWRDVLAPPGMPSRPIRNVVVFGAGGPLGAVTALELAPSYRLRLTDARPIPDIIAEARPQMPGAPLPTLLGEPHEYRVVDVRDPAQVLAACEGMDAIVNCAVVRWVVPEAFRVNILGMFHILRAAQVHGIKRIVQTGPFMVNGPAAVAAAYAGDYDLTEAAPPRTLDYLYHHTKFLSHELARVFAEQLGLEVPVLLYAGLTDPALPGGPDGAFFISWADAARAVRRALEVPSLPSPLELFHVAVERPDRKYDFRKLKTVLGWEPQDTLDHHWRR